jgi:hypothetical protein
MKATRKKHMKKTRHSESEMVKIVQKLESGMQADVVRRDS